MSRPSSAIKSITRDGEIVVLNYINRTLDIMNTNTTTGDGAENEAIGGENAVINPGDGAENEAIGSIDDVSKEKAAEDIIEKLESYSQEPMFKKFIYLVRNYDANLSVLEISRAIYLDFSNSSSLQQKNIEILDMHEEVRSEIEKNVEQVLRHSNQ